MTGGMWVIAVMAFIIMALPLVPDSVKSTVFVIAAILIGFFGWKNSLRKRQLVSGTPTARIATAAKGYAELRGVARNALDVPLYDPITNEPCVWFDIVTEKLNLLRFRWERVASARSKRAFAIEDESGLCLVTPDTADFVPPKGTVVREKLTLKHTLKRVVDGQPVYALGHLERIDQGAGGATKPVADPTATREFEGRVSALMREWKRDPRRRAEMFDPNRDGMTDDAEMERARRAAREEIAERLQRADSRLENATPLRTTLAAGPSESYSVGGRPVTHWLRTPDDGRPYIVSAVLEKELIARERRAGCAFLLLFIFFTFGALAWLAKWLGALPVP